MDIDFSRFYTSLVVIAIIIAFGTFLGKIKWVDKATNKKLVNLLLMVFMPASLFNAFPGEYSEEFSGLFFMGLTGGVVTMLLVIIAAKVVYNKKFFPGELSYEAQFSFDFNNATFLGYPLISMAFGERGIVPYCGFIIAFNLALFSYGVWLFERKIDAKFILKTIVNPNILAVLIGMVLFLCHVNVEKTVPILHDSVKYIAGATTPLSLLSVGYMLSTAKIRHIFKKWKLFIVAAIQLIFAPVITFLVTRVLFKFPDEVVLICTLIQALPTATSLGLFAEKYGGDVAEASQIVVISTLMSIATMPTIMTLLFVTLPQYM
ncbi:AEC family transporter [Candidatus Saccharibacteria bacterium]|nr:AEC family transporter [Candidatus Saccharibacteria bacterium]